MQNRWSPAARVAALAVRRAKSFQRGKAKNGSASPSGSSTVYAGGTATFDERTGKYVTASPVKDIQADKVGVPSSGSTKPKGVTTPGGAAVKDVFAGGSATFDERTGKRVVAPGAKLETREQTTSKRVPTGPIYRDPPPDSPYWKDPKFVASWKRSNPGKRVPIRNRVFIAGKRYTRVGDRLVPDVR